MRARMLAVLVGLLLVHEGPAQTPVGRLRWQAGQVLTYRAEQATVATETTAGGTVETRATLGLVKRWQVAEVDARGVATLHLSLAALRHETVTPAGETLLFDSAAPDKSDPQLREQMGRFVGPRLAVLRVDGRGQVVEVKESAHGPASRFHNELPFALLLPESGPAAGQAWERNYQITLDPPYGAGDKYDATQKYECKNVADGVAVVRLTTALKAQPKATADQVPLLKLQPEGEVYFDVANGRLKHVRLKVEKELSGHQGDGSNLKFQSTYSEDFVGDK